MRSTKLMMVVSIGLATAGLGIGFGLAGLWVEAGVSVGLGLLWLGLLWRGRREVTGLMVVGLVGLAAYGTWRGVTVGWMLGTVAATLVAWDLADFSRRLAEGGQLEDTTALQRAHWLRLLGVVGLGLVVSGAALSFEVQLNLGWIILLGGAAVFGLSRVVGRLRDGE